MMFASRVLRRAINPAKKRLTSVEDLQDHGFLPANAGQGYYDLARRYTIGVTAHIAGLIGASRQGIMNDPVAMQYIPSLEELHTTPQERADPIGDEAHSPVKGIVHRYPDRVLLKVTHLCAVYCRYCFRREMLGPDQEHMTASDFERSFDYIKSNKNIWEVILTGGDPLILSARRLEQVMEALSGIDHVRVVRIHTRIPVASPAQVTEDLLAVLRSVAQEKTLYAVVHINHEREITPEVEAAFVALRSCGVSLLSQSVLLKGINNDAATLEALFRRLVTLHVKPYYLHHPDFARGTSHFRVSLAQGQEIMRALQGRVSGLCLPSYVLDIPGGYGKAPVQHNYVSVDDKNDHSIFIEDYQGALHAYSDEGMQ